MRHRRWRILGMAILFAAVAHATALRPPLAPAPEGVTPAVPVILISIDTLRADHLTCFGYTKLKTPNIDALARGGTLFTQISSQAPITLPSHVSLFTHR